MIENQPLDPQDSISLVENYFKTYLEGYKLEKDSGYTGYWWVEYINEEKTRICFEGDIGGHFSVKIFIGGTEYALWQFDQSVINATKTTERNLLYQLETLKRFLLSTV